MDQFAACIILRGTIYDWYSLPFIAVCVVVIIAASYWRFFIQWLEGVRGRNWPTVSAVVDVVSVILETTQTRNGERIVGYLATLTYFYSNPELQIGEYKRMFNEENEAQAWAASYKGRTVLVHVDPRDPKRSVLRKEEL